MARAEEYAKLHRQYLEQEAPEKIRALTASGELVSYLERVGQIAVELEENLEAQMLTAKDLPHDYLERVNRLEQIPHIVSEIVMNDVIYNKTP